MLLTSEQLVDLTHRDRPSAQMRALRAMGIQFVERPDGTPAVSLRHVEAILGEGLAPKSPQEPVIDWSLAK